MLNKSLIVNMGKYAHEKNLLQTLTKNAYSRLIYC